MQDDMAFIAAATQAIFAPYHPEGHATEAALGLRSGVVVTGINLDATVGRIGVCAEGIAFGRVVTEFGAVEG